MTVLYNTTVIKKYDRRRLGLSNAPLNMEYGSSITEEYPPEHTYNEEMTFHVAIEVESHSAEYPFVFVFVFVFAFVHYHQVYHISYHSSLLLSLPSSS